MGMLNRNSGNCGSAKKSRSIQIHRELSSHLTFTPWFLRITLRVTDTCEPGLPLELRNIVHRSTLPYSYNDIVLYFHTVEV